MATTAIWDVKGWVGHIIKYADNPEKTLNVEWGERQKQNMLDVMEYAMQDAKKRGLINVLDYATADFKTEQQHYVTGINCPAKYARQAMLNTKKQWNKKDGIIAFHGYQSFAPGEVTAELAHRIGVELAEKLWGNRFEIVVATHLNTKCFHNHFVLNSVSFADGYRYYDNKKTYKQMRRESDKLCQKYALSIITEPKGRSRHYAEWQADNEGKPTWRSAIREDVDGIISTSVSYQAFLRALRDKGYEIKMGKHIAVRPPGKERFVRLRSLGNDYEEDAIKKRILNQRMPAPPTRFPRAPNKQAVFKGSFHLYRITWKGLRAQHYYFLNKLRQTQRQPKGALFLLRDELRNLDAISRQAEFLHKHKFDTAEQLLSYAADLDAQMKDLSILRKRLKNERRWKCNLPKKEEYDARINALTEQIKPLYRDKKMCEKILERSLAIRGKLDQMQAVRREEKDEPIRRRGRTSRQHGG